MSRVPQPGVCRSAPMRLDFAGGWTDVNPFAAREGGAVVNAALTLRVHAEFVPGGQGLLLRADDLGEAAVIRRPEDLDAVGSLDLHRAALRMRPVGPGVLRTWSSAPPGSGLGSSGALDVALLAVLAAARGETMAPEELADEGWRLEVIEAGHAGGRQDQLAAALGGFHQLGFAAEGVSVRELQLDTAFREELERRLLVCYTGRSRVSGDTIARVMGAYQRSDQGVAGALRRMAELAHEMAEALMAADLSRVGALMDANWRCQQHLDPGMRTGEMAALEQALAGVGVLGRKAAGAGAGGSMFFLLSGRVEDARRAVLGTGAEILEAGWSSEGVTRC